MGVCNGLAARWAAGNKAQVPSQDKVDISLLIKVWHSYATSVNVPRIFNLYNVLK